MKRKSFHTVYLGVGSNLGDRKEMIRTALQKLGSEGIAVTRTSHWYETLPVGDQHQGPFINGVVEGKTVLSPSRLLTRLKSIERELGRKPTRRWGPRPIDLDILLYDRRKIHTSHLTVPHARLLERGFTLIPLSELLPLNRLPGLHREPI